MAENSAKQTPSVEDLKWWADQYGLTHPVVADANFEVALGFLEQIQKALPVISDCRTCSCCRQDKKLKASVPMSKNEDVEAYLPEYPLTQ